MRNPRVTLLTLAIAFALLTVLGVFAPDVFVMEKGRYVIPGSANEATSTVSLQSSVQQDPLEAARVDALDAALYAAATENDVGPRGASASNEGIEAGPTHHAHWPKDDTPDLEKYGVARGGFAGAGVHYGGGIYGPAGFGNGGFEGGGFGGTGTFGAPHAGGFPSAAGSSSEPGSSAFSVTSNTIASEDLSSLMPGSGDESSGGTPAGTEGPNGPGSSTQASVVTPVPEPSSYALVLCAFTLLCLLRAARRRQARPL